jgi:predicted RecA/RadA family phage recombinase
MRPRIILTVVAGLLAVQGCTAEPTAPEAHPPVAGIPVVLDARIPGWETSAWLAEDAFCVRAARADGKRAEGKENESVFCDPAPSALDTVGGPLLPAKPLPYLAPQDPRSREIILVGTVRGVAVTTVSVTMFGQTATGTVRPLPASDGRQVGAYALWLPRSGVGGEGMDLSDITAVVGRDAAGSIVTQLE